ncbi:hypothetical protein [Micromonospora pallida]|uniref:hypothetical protein n=1 Tax=Micromonospora pallida TaxID=145854 RepID=UPI00114CD38E|nr:hypothetical protein [Micromonospora pallida]
MAATTHRPPQPEEESSQADKSTSRRDLILKIGGAVGTAFLGAVAAVALERKVAPGQAVRDDRAVERAERTRARNKPPIATGARYHDRSSDSQVWLFGQTFTSDQEEKLLRGRRREIVDDASGLAGGIAGVHGGQSLTYTRIRIELLGQWVKPVPVTGIRARVDRRLPPLSGTYLYQGSEGAEEPLEIGFDLDEPKSVARTRQEGSGELGEAYFDRHSLTLSLDEPLSIDIQAQTSQSYCEWVIEMTLLVDNKEEVLVVDDYGKPFRSTALAPHYGARYHLSVTDGQWKPDGSGPPIERSS